MASPNSKYHKHFAGLDDLTPIEMKRPYQILGEESRTNATKPAQKNSTTSIPEKDQDLTLTKEKLPEEEGGASRPPMLTISLTKEEIEEDMLIFTGKRPLRCKKKRDKKTKQDLETLFPCSSLDGHDANDLRERYGQS